MALNVDQALARARGHAARGEIAAAAEIYAGVLEKFPKNQRALRGLAVLRETKPNPTSGPAPSQGEIDRLIALYGEGKFRESADRAEALLRRFPDEPLLQNIFGAALAALGETEAAIELFRKALRARPDFSDAHTNLGNAYRSQGKLVDAIKSYVAAIQINPADAGAYNNLGVALLEKDQPKDAIEAFSRATRFKPDFAEARYGLGRSLSLIGKEQAALESLRQAIALDPRHFRAHLAIGDLCQELGDRESAVNAFKRAVEVKPDSSIGYLFLSRLVRFEPGDPLIGKMEDLLNAAEATEIDKVHLRFALSKAYFDLGELAHGMVHLDAGNTLRKSMLGYSIDRDRKRFADIRSYFTRNRGFPALQAKPLRARPIFVVGMPRSGTTLIEQVLASHPDVYGAGELPYFSRLMDQLAWRNEPASSELLTQIRSAYFATIDVPEGKSFFTDKLPANFRWVGFIAKAIPEAKIVHVRRKAEAVCWSNYRIFFPLGGFEYSFDKVDVALYYRLYEELMTFWNGVVPESVFTIDYDHFTENQEEDSRALLRHVGLEWDESVLHFERNVGRVSTASNLQVKRGLYTGSSVEWERFADWLQPMLGALRAPKQPES